jgi:hypothetical protein
MYTKISRTADKITLTNIRNKTNSLIIVNNNTPLKLIIFVEF